MKKLFLVFVLFILLICSSALAETQTFNLTYSDTVNNQKTFTDAGGQNYNIPYGYLYINYDGITNPSVWVWQSSQLSGVISQSGTFNITDQGQTVATGTFTHQNGTFSGKYTSQLALYFTSFNKYDRTGNSFLANLNTVPALTGSSNCPATYEELIDMPIGIENRGIRRSGEGYYILNDNIYASSGVMLDNGANGNPARVNVDKLGYNSKFYFYSAQNLTYYESTPSAAWLNFGLWKPNNTNLVVQAQFFGKYNVSSAQYFNSIPAPTPTPTTTTTTQAGGVDNTVYVGFPITDSTMNALIPLASLNIFNVNTGIWSNITSTTGYSMYQANKSDVLNVYASKTGYNPNQLIGAVASARDYVITLTPSGGTPIANNTRFRILVQDGTDQSVLQNVMLSVSGEYVATGYTNGAGYYEFLVPTNGAYKNVNVNAFLNNYYSTTIKANVSGNTYQTGIYLARKTIAPTPTYTAPTISQTLAPTQTISGGWNNTQSGTENVCVQLPYPLSWGYWDVVKNGIACSGVKGVVNQNLVFSIIIMMICALMLAKSAKGIGALAGVIAGAGVSFAMGILPIWVLIFIIVVCGIIIARMIMGAK